ncbi:hypothetical protein MMC26_005876 [Xylographa opegraphella]|nr:hypothetical protein [Xylographa opegraphella]
MENLTILLVGNGGREHALAWKLNQSSRVKKIFVVPGNGGTGSGSLDTVENVSNIQAEDFDALMAFAKEKGVNLVVPGPEAPLVAGIEGACRAAGLRCFGPSKVAARMEGSKTFAKDFMARHKIPTAAFQNFNDYEKAKLYLESVSHDVVIKASGIAAGKGVMIPATKEMGLEALKDIMLKREFGAAGDEVVIEEFLVGEELSILSFSDGYTVKSLPAAQDHKQVFDNDQGPMTGGMGCYAPTKVATSELVQEIHRTIIQPTIDGMRKERMPFVGLLFTGLMITRTGPKVLEYNVRFGDPETQTLLPLLSAETDLAEVMLACTEHWLDAVELKIDSKFSATVVACAGGYPGPYVRGDEVQLEEPAAGTMIFHAGTTISSDTLKTSGGRIIAANSTGATLTEAIEAAYQGISTIKFSGMHYRKDIGHRALKVSESTTENTSPTSEVQAALTYASAGVSISSGNELVKRIIPLVKSTARPGADASIGGFGGVVDLQAAGYYQPPLLIGAIDGVGTKLNIAHEMRKHDTVGIDCVAMNVNDLVVQGAEALFFLDCYTCGKLDVDVAAAFVQGVARGCIEAGCALVGGETSEMPGLFGGEGTASKEDGGKYDAVGAAVGALPQGRKLLPDKDSMVAGDVVLGLASDGCHSNGFSLIRKILQRAKLSVHDAAPWDPTASVGASLLVPTRIYVKPLLRVAGQALVKGMSHITGGGLLENVPRMLPAHLAAELDAGRWPLPAVFRWLKTAGALEEMEVATVFNMGLGMVLVVAEADVVPTIMTLENAGETVFEVGRLVPRAAAQPGCLLKGLEAWR